MKPNSHQLLAFASVMQAGSFSAAAHRMGVTQSALSQHIKKLEQQVGARLVIRGAQGLELTRLGAELFELAERYHAVSKEIEEHLSGFSNFDRGHLNIVANAPQPALSTIARYGHAYPNVEISFSLFDWTRTMSMLADHSVDIAFVTKPRFLNDCNYKKLSETKYALYVRADHALAQRGSVSLHEITSETLILPEPGSLTQKVVSKAFDTHGIQPRRKLVTTTFPVMKEAILHGIGIGIFLMDASAPNEDLVQVRLDDLTQPFEIYAATPKHKAGLRLVQSFWGELTDFSA